MRGLLKGALVLGLALAMASVVQAQQRGRGVGPGAMLQNESVQKELNLTDEQKTKLREALMKVRDNHQDDLAKLRDLSNEERQKLLRTISEESQKAIASVLDEKQMKRFKQIGWQATGANALNDSEVQKALKLSDEQKKKLQDIIADSNQKMREAFQGGGGREKIQEIRKETQEKANGVLTDEQKKNWKEMQGAPFEFQRRQP